jgi:23S rRNA pseudouridine1911/1915/1917 synthase
LVSGLAAVGHAITRSQLARAFADRAVTVDGKPIKASLTIDEPLSVRVVLPTPEPLSAAPEPIPLQIVHDDDAILVIDKAPGMAVHPGPGHPGGTVVNAVLHHLGVQADALPVLEGNDAYRPGIVHRIDRDTSGLLVVAKHRRALEALAAQFREHDITREYLGIVRGQPTFEDRRVETSHARDPADRRRFAPAVRGATRTAITRLFVVERLGPAALMRFELQTGRTHQIRMHARHLSHPLLGDVLYGRPPKHEGVKRVAERLGRHALHAARLGFVHPETGSLVSFRSALPSDLQDALTALREIGADTPTG